jgi:hypothetical protein
MAKNEKKIPKKIIENLNQSALRNILANTKMINLEGLDNLTNEDNPDRFGSFGIGEGRDDDDDEEVYKTNNYTEEVSFIEFAILNGYLMDSYRGNQKDITINKYGGTDNIGRLEFGGVFQLTGAYWFMGQVPDIDNEFIFQTKMFVDSRGDLNAQFHLSTKTDITYEQFQEVSKEVKKLAFNNSEYTGKCIKVKMRDGGFKGIEIIDIKEASNELILNKVQKKYIDHFISRVGKGGNARYLLNGEPGTGKTESIREICRRLVPNVTFIIPDFNSEQDLTSIMEACEIFDNAVIIMDDIDLFLGSRDVGSYTRMLGQFLSFFDGVKKRKISLLASTNDKGLVDKAAERPGRFNFTLDYSFLNDEQIKLVCNIHLEEKWRTEEVYQALSGKINGRKVNITGAFIANLAENIREMSVDDENWVIDDTISLIEESYKGFYSSQVEKNKESMGFKV